MPNPSRRPVSARFDPARITPRDRTDLRRWNESPGVSTPVSDADVPTFIRDSWRWHDRQALAYELDRAVAKRDAGRRAAAVGAWAGRVGLVGGAAAEGKFGKGPALMRVGGLLGRSTPGAAAALVGEVGARDAVYFDRRVVALQRRLAEIEPRR